MIKWRSEMSWELAKRRAKFYQDIRIFFNSKLVTEVETPLLTTGTITDPYLDSFSTKYDFLETEIKTFNLQTSPEYCMKRLLASGYGDIYQLCKAFRDEPHGKQHNPEFSILEWYRLGFDHFDLMKEVEELLVVLLECDKANYLSYQEAFITHTNIDPLTTTILELKSYLSSIGKLDNWLEKETSLDTFLQFIFTEVIELSIGIDAPCFIYGFPVSQASLARSNDTDPRISDRFECYYKGIELVNGFNELTCPKQQKSRFDNDNIIRQNSGLPVKEVDVKLLAALNSGLPQCSGVALGIDRLFMLLMDTDDIKDILSFNIENA